MSLELCILASGSAGNCAVVRTAHGLMLIDCGIGPRACAKRMEKMGVNAADIRAICLTHLDSDHFNLHWLKTIVAWEIRLFCRQQCVADVMRAVYGEPEFMKAFERLLVPFEGLMFAPLAGVTAQSIPFAHDRMGSHGFVIECNGTRLGYATDLGRVPSLLFERFCGLHLLAMESNYDPQMQMNSRRPAMLKQRIMGGSGHLSNEQALAAIRRILDRCEAEGSPMPAHIVLLHRSDECNCPDLIRRLFCQDARIAKRLTLADQLEPTQWLRPTDVQPAVGEQLALRWG